MGRLDKLPYHARTHLPGGSDPIIGLGGGIQFDTAPQRGNFLEVEVTTGAMHLYSLGANSDGIYLYSDTGTDGWISLIAGNSPDWGGTVYIEADTITNRLTDGGGFRVQKVGGNAVFHIAETGYGTFNIGSGANFLIRNSAAASIFRVDEDGTIHGPTGGSITWDL